MPRQWDEEINDILCRVASKHGEIGGRDLRKNSAGAYRWISETGFDWRERAKHLGLRVKEVPGRGRVLTQGAIDAALRKAADADGRVMAQAIKNLDRGLYTRLLEQGFDWAARAEELGLTPGSALDRSSTFTEAEVEAHLRAIADDKNVLVLDAIKKKRSGLYSWIKRTDFDWEALAWKLGLQPGTDSMLLNKVSGGELTRLAFGKPMKNVSPAMRVALAYIDRTLRAAADDEGRVAMLKVRAVASPVYNWLARNDFDWEGRCRQIGLQGRITRPRGYWLNKDNVLAALRDLAAELGKTPIRQEFALHGYQAANINIERLFGGYENALAAAGLTPDPNAQREPGFYADDKKVKRLLRLFSDKDGFLPTTVELRALDSGLEFGLRQRFQSLKKAYRALGFKMRPRRPPNADH